jgi:hypothetical protein
MNDTNLIVSPSAPSVARVPHLVSDGWADDRFGTQHWLERAAWRTLRDTNNGVAIEPLPVHPGLFEDPLLRKVYELDVALFIGAEETSYKAVAAMIGFAPDEASQIQLGTQVMDECRHFEVFSRRLADFGVTPQRRRQLVDRYTTKSLKQFYELILEQVDKRDFYAASLAQNLTLEGMAYPLYRYEIKYWSRFDPNLSRIIQGAFADESNHVGFGEALNAEYLKRTSTEQRARLLVLIRQFHQLMTAVFEEVIHHYVGLYQECANQYRDFVGDIEIFPGRKLADIDEAEQTRVLLKEIQDEHQRRLTRLGIA